MFLHVSSLPSPYGVGNIGSAADSFMEFLHGSGFSYWQICPLGPTGYGDSPYQSFSAFAGNIYFIDYTQLCEAGLLHWNELDALRNLPDDRCDFGAIYGIIPDLMRRAYARFKSGEGVSLDFPQRFEDFCKDNAHWLDAYALYMALKREFGGVSWTDWKPEFRDFKKAVSQKLSDKAADEAMSVKFGQWVFFSQYALFKEKANAKGIGIFGDLPIFLAQDSADVWANPSIFELNRDGTPKNVAGVGPDYFSAEGQLWGNPLYDWNGAKDEVYEFWRRRIEASCGMYDVIRFDHFRGFADYWSIPAESGDARKGVWKKGPGTDFFNFLRKHFPEQKFVAEDLGLLSDAAVDLRDALDIPAMAVLQFAFGSDSSNAYLPHNVRRESVYYTGTHDNNTARGWYDSSPECERDIFRRYFRVSGDAVNWDMIHAVLISVARMAVFPMQDILGLGQECRMNTPGKPDGNWAWRMTEGQLAEISRNNGEYLKSVIALSGRAPKKKAPENAEILGCNSPGN